MTQDIFRQNVLHLESSAFAIGALVEQVLANSSQLLQDECSALSTYPDNGTLNEIRVPDLDASPWQSSYDCTPEAASHKAIASDQREPVARHLFRRALENISDHVAGLLQQAMRMDAGSDPDVSLPVLQELCEMADAMTALAQESVQGFLQKNFQQAQVVYRQIMVLDRQCQRVLTELREALLPDDRQTGEMHNTVDELIKTSSNLRRLSATTLLSMIALARHCERIVRDVGHICEDVMCMIAVDCTTRTDLQ